MTVKTIARLSGMKIEKSKRNGRDRKNHMVLARTALSLDYPEGKWRWKYGKSPSKTTKKKEQVRKWRAENPTGTKAACARELAIDWKTAAKYWFG